MTRALFFALVISTAAAAQPQPRTLTLDDALKLALERNTDLRKQALIALSSEQDKVIARSAILPSLSFNASVGGARTAGEIFQSGESLALISNSKTYPTGSVNLNVRQLIFDGGKWWNTMDAADLGLKASQASVDEQRLQLVYLVEQRFYELVRAQRQLQVLADAAQRSREQAESTQRLFEGGRGTQADIYAARANRDNDEIQRLSQEGRVEAARADLSLAVGLEPGEPVVVAEPPQLMNEPAEPPAIDAAVQHALENRPSLKAFTLSIEANRKSTTAAHGDYWPTLSFQAGWGRSTNADIGQLFRSPDQESTAGASINLSWNIFSGLATDANVRKAELATLQSENDLVAGRRAVAADVQKAAAQLATARAVARVAVQSEATAKEGLRLARTRQEIGSGTQLEVRDAELKLTQAQLSRVGALVDGREAEAALRRAQGG